MTIALTTPDFYARQQTGGEATFNLDGTYSGTPTTIEYSSDGVNFFTGDATPTGGVFDFPITLPTGQYTVTVRFSNDVGDNDSITFVTIGDGFLLTGQSNMSGRGTNNQTYTQGTYKSILLGNDDLYREMVDPTDSNVNQVDAVSDDASAAGSWVMRFANYWSAGFNTPVFFIPCAKGGTTIAQWLKGTGLYDSSIRRAALTGGVSQVMFHLGGSDAISLTLQTTFENRLNAMADDLMADLGAKTLALPLHTLPSPSYDGNGTTTGQVPIRNAILNVAASNVNVGTTASMTHIDLSGGDGNHFQDDADLDEVASITYDYFDQLLVIDLQPLTQAVPDGDPVTLTSLAGNSTSSQWYKDDVLQGGETGNNLIIASFNAGDVGSYHNRFSVAGQSDVDTDDAIVTLEVVASNNPHFTFTLPTVTGSHADTPILFTEVNMPTESTDGGLISIDDGGGNFIAYEDDTKSVRLPVEIVRFVTGVTPDIQVWVKTTAQTGETIYIEADDVQTSQPLPGALFGSESVWSFYEFVTHDGVTDSTGNYPGAFTITGTPTVDTDRFGNQSAYTFGSGDRINADVSSRDPQDGLIGSSQITYEIWSNAVTSAQGQRAITVHGQSIGFSAIGFNYKSGDIGANVFIGGDDQNDASLAYRGATDTTLPIFSSVSMSLDKTTSPPIVVVSGNSLSIVTETNVQAGTTSRYICMGSRGDGSNQAFGTFAEFRYAKQGISADRSDVNEATYINDGSWGTSSAWEVGGGLDVSITESFAGFSESIFVNTTPLTQLNISITESFSGFSETINVSTSPAIPLSISITETFGGFSEIIGVSVPINITVNPKNIISVKRKNNIVRVR